MKRRELIKSAFAAGMGMGVQALLPTQSFAAPTPDESAFNVKLYGAKGDGITDDTGAVQTALTAAIKNRCSHVHFPSGRYRITQSLNFTSTDRLDVTGEGASSVLLHENDEPLLLWPKEHSCRNFSLRHLCFTSTVNNKSRYTAVISCLGGAEQSFFSHLTFNTEGAVKMGSGIYVERVMDTTTIDHCLMWGPITGIGIRIAKGSEVRIFGGRIIGGTDKYAGRDPESIGIHLTENNGGVHVVTTDLISLGTAIKIGDTGTQSNREVFITHATCDSSVHGIVQVDGAYTSIIGCWSASSDEEQILLTETAENALMVISGGTIYNGGTYGRPGAHNGMVVRAGSFLLNGVAIRQNKGVGLLVEGPEIKDYAVTGCRFSNNGTGAIFRGRNYSVTGNVFSGNEKHMEQVQKENGLITSNVMD